MQNYRIEMRSYRLVGYAGSALLIMGACGAAYAHQYWPSFGLLAFSFVGLYVALGAGEFLLGDDCIVHESAFGRWQILWSDVTAAETSPSGTLLLLGQNKRFVLAPPSWWSGSERESAFAFVMKKLEERHIKPKPSNTADYSSMKNTRIKRS